VVLVAPEGGQRSEGVRRGVGAGEVRGEHLGGVLGGVRGDGPVLDAAGHGVVAGVGEAGDVADGDDVGAAAGAQVLVGQDAVGEVEAVAFEPLGVGGG